MIFWIGFGVVWLLLALFAAGTMTAYYQRKYPSIAAEGYRMDLAVSLAVGLFGGPIAVLVTTFYSGIWQYGWSLLPFKDAK